MLLHAAGPLPDWEYQLNVYAFDPLELVYQRGEIDLFDAHVGIYFPHDDMLSLIERLKAINVQSAEAAVVEQAA